MKLTHLLFLALALPLIFAGCSRGTKITHSPSSSTVEFSPSGIQKMENLPWQVGRPERTSLLSKGMRLEVALPHFSRDELVELAKDYQLDGLIGRIGRLQEGRKDYIAHFYIPMVYQKNDSNWPRNVTTASLQILYADAAPSKRFENFPCPVFGHNLRIEKGTISQGEVSRLTVTKGRASPFGGNPTKLEFGAVSFNGGKKLAGTYWAELAFYNSLKSQVLGDFVLLAGTLTVPLEKSIPVTGCNDFVIPSKEAQDTPHFKFGR